MNLLDSFKRTGFFVLFFGSFFFCSIFSSSLMAGDFWIIHSNDRHGYVEPVTDGISGSRTGGAGVEATIIDSIKLDAIKHEVPCLLVDCGDFFQGTPVVNATKGKVMIDLFNAMKYHFVTFGNHEFDYGWQELKQRMKESNFLWVSSTVEAPNLDGLYRPWLTYTLNGTKVAFLGATTPSTPDKQLKNRIEGIIFHEPLERLKPIIALLKRDSEVKIIVLISHLGLNTDMELAQVLPEIDLILGGHSHSILKEPVKVGNTWICQTGTASKYLGVVKVETDSTGHFKDVVSHLEPVEQTAWIPSVKIESIVSRYTDELENELSEVLGVAPFGISKGVRGGIAPLARVVALSFREAADADIGFMNVGGARKSIPSGEVTLKHVRTAVPFGNYVVKLHMKGRDIRKVIESAVDQPFNTIPESQVEQVLSRGVTDLSGLIPEGSNNGFIIGDGLTYVFDPRKDVGSRVISITVGEQPLDDNKVYSIATNDFLADGGDGFVAFKSSIIREDMDLIDSEAFREWCNRQDSILVPSTMSVINLSFKSHRDYLSGAGKAAVNSLVLN
jgi:2',3'-cyclic-nucleotide 2'-phosphodiesterase (5'-nucleotidase family)